MTGTRIGVSRPEEPFQDEQFTSLFDELYSSLCRFSIKFVSEKEIAEDIVQEQFIYLWENRGRLKGVASLKSYLYTAVKHRSINYLKKLYVRNTHYGLDELPGNVNHARLPDPLELIENKELETILEHAVQSLPVKCRTIFTLKKFGELSNKEIAQKLDVSVKTVEAQMTIAFKKLTVFVSSRWGLILIFFLHRFREIL
jgi:RNA polymerase sigma-70 factor, ECF subfamily